MKYNPKVVLAYWCECGLPFASRELVFAPPRRWRFDFAFQVQRVAIEVEGGVWTGGRHTRGSGFAKDMEKYNEAAARGWRVLRCQPKDVCTLDFVNIIRSTLTYINQDACGGPKNDSGRILIGWMDKDGGPFSYPARPS